MATTQRLPRKGLKTGPKTELSVFLKVKPGHEKQIREVFQSRTDEYKAQAKQSMIQTASIHDARQVLFDNDTRVLVATSYDTPYDLYMDDFEKDGFVPRDWDKFLVHCEGYPDEESGPYPRLDFEDVKNYLVEHQEEAVAYTSIQPDLTIREMWKADLLLKAFQKVLDDPKAAKALEDPALKPLLDLAAD